MMIYDDEWWYTMMTMIIYDDEYDDVYDDNDDGNYHEGTLAVIDVEAEVGAHSWFRVDHL